MCVSENTAHIDAETSVTYIHYPRYLITTCGLQDVPSELYVLAGSNGLNYLGIDRRRCQQICRARSYVTAARRIARRSAPREKKLAAAGVAGKRSVINHHEDATDIITVLDKHGDTRTMLYLHGYTMCNCMPCAQIT